MKVCMFSYNECDKYYITARRVARSLAQAGYEVRIIALFKHNVEPYEDEEGYRIYRVKFAPLRRMMLWLLSLSLRLERKLFSSQPNRPVANSSVVKGEGKTSRSATSLTRAKVEETTTRGPSRAGAFVKRHNSLLRVYRLCRLLYSRRNLRRLYRRFYSMRNRLIWRIPQRYLSYLEYYYHCYRLARQEPADVYHAHDLVTLPVAWLCSRLTGGKLVYDSHELWLDLPGRQRSRLNRFIVQSIESLLVRRTDANIIAGVSIGRVLSERYSIAMPTVILNAPFYRNFQSSCIFRDELGIPAEERILLYMGRISWERGVEEAVRSLRYLSRRSLVIFGFGDNNYLSSLKELIRNEGVMDRVYFFGAVPFDEVTRYAMSADVSLVLHKNVSLDYYYVSPCKLFESMAAGLPMVGSNFPDLKMYIEGYGLGVTCDPDSPKEIADAIDYILSDQNRYEEMRHNALEAAKIFNWENESKKLLAIYEGLSDRTND